MPDTSPLVHLAAVDALSILNGFGRAVVVGPVVLAANNDQSKPCAEDRGVDRGGPKSRQQPARGWRASIRELRPDLYSAVNPWDRITEAEALRELLSAGGVSDAEITAEQGTQPLRSGEDW